mmetsp:Transcript_75634/g.133644  ORF Transcript_75634/g.133644 Transcript_75634/m.133644 type:complete len:81 (-) Transcript_75634:1803-2045(-)
MWVPGFTLKNLPLKLLPCILTLTAPPLTPFPSTACRPSRHITKPCSYPIISGMDVQFGSQLYQSAQVDFSHSCTFSLMKS